MTLEPACGQYQKSGCQKHWPSRLALFFEQRDSGGVSARVLCETRHRLLILVAGTDASAQSAHQRSMLQACSLEAYTVICQVLVLPFVCVLVSELQNPLLP